MPETQTAPFQARVYRCSFCRKPQNELKRMIAGPGVFICNECVDLCVPIMATEAPTPDPTSLMTPDTAPTELLLTTLKGYDGAFEAIGAGMQDLVDVLREREVSWAVIGETLGVSRQAAWKRFS